MHQLGAAVLPMLQCDVHGHAATASKHPGMIGGNITFLAALLRASSMQTMPHSETSVRTSTVQTPAPDRAAHWGAIASDAYFPLSPDFRALLRFNGCLSRLGLGTVGLSRLTSSEAET